MMPFLDKMIKRGLLLGLFLTLAVPKWGWTHGGEQHGTPAATVGGLGPVELSEKAKLDLGVETEEINLRTIETLVRCFGVVEPLPGKVHWVTTRFAGRMIEIFVNAGDMVKEGDRLALAESRQIGSPPPRVDIISTLTGNITERNVVVGQPFEPSSILFRIMELSSVLVKCHVYETDIGRMAIGQRVYIYPEAFGGERAFVGTVRTIGGQIDESTRTLPVWVEIQNTDLTLRPGMRARAEIVVGESRNTIAAPLASVLGGAGNYFVFIDRGRDYLGQPIGLGSRDDRYVEIIEGLFPGDRVVTQGAYQIQFAAAIASSAESESGPKKIQPKSSSPVESKDKEDKPPTLGVTLSSLAQQNLGIQTAEVEVGTVDKVATNFGNIEAVPESIHQISTRTSGSVIKVLVNEGDTVQKNQLLAVIESRQVGNPPPHIEAHATRNGIVTERHVFAGEPVDVGKTLFTLVDLSSVLVKSHVYEIDVTQVRIGQLARVYTQAYPDKAFEGVVERVSGQIEEETRTLPVWIRVENPELKLRPHMRARVSLIIGLAASGIIIPREAILESAEQTFVFLKEGSFFKRQAVNLGPQDDRFVEITSGLLPGDQVVARGNRQLQFAVNSPMPPNVQE